MKNIITAFLLAASSFYANCQTTATNFSGKDCSNNSHELFADLNAGKVVVVAWVMPCSNCINDARGAYDAMQSFATSNPGKVVYYLVDDLGNTTCSSLASWAANNGIGSDAIIFGNTGNTISESNYGGSGMPHIVVMGPNKQIYFNMKNGSGDYTAIKDAISNALAKASISNETVKSFTALTYPNPVSRELTVELENTDPSLVKFEIYNTAGEDMTEFVSSSILNKNQKINISNLKAGIYILKLKNISGEVAYRFTVAK